MPPYLLSSTSTMVELPMDGGLLPPGVRKYDDPLAVLCSQEPMPLVVPSLSLGRG